MKINKLVLALLFITASIAQGQIQLQIPADGSTIDVSTQFKWIEPSPKPDKYFYQFDTTANFNSSQLVQGIRTNSYRDVTPSGLKFGKTYYWRVAKVIGSDTLDYSVAWKVHTRDTIVLSNLKSGEQNKDVEILLDWVSHEGCTKFECQLDTNASFSTGALITKVQNSSQSSVTVKGLRYGTRYLWRVRGISVNDTTSWSNLGDFSTLDTIVLSSPADGSVLGNVTVNLTWDSNGESGFVVEIDTAVTFDSGIKKEVIIRNGNNYTYLSGLIDYQKYYWRVKGVSGTDTSKSSQIRTFYTNQTVTSTVGISDEEIEVYPNPFNEFIIVNSTNIFRCQLYDMAGNLIVDTSESSISTVGLEQGLYLLKVNHGGSITSKKMVKRNL